MNPQITSGVVNQVHWPKAGDVDDCWVCSVLGALHACAPWLRLPNIEVFRAAAGNPDEPNKPDGGTIRQSSEAIKKLWPLIAPLTQTAAGEHTWSWLVEKVKAEGRVASVFVKSSELPANYGFGGLHAIAVAYINGVWRISNPLAPAQSRWDQITENALERAVKAFPNPGVHAIVFPTVEEAFATHPLYLPPGTPDPVELAEARDAGYAEAKQKARDASDAAIAAI
jgi:hypothetical protein